VVGVVGFGDYPFDISIGAIVLRSLDKRESFNSIVIPTAVEESLRFLDSISFRSK